MDSKYIAHVRKNDDNSWAVPHSLMNHMEGTSKLAEIFAAKFYSDKWGKAVGLAHDAGKGRLVWQSYIQNKTGFFDEDAHLEGKSGKIPHAIHGAKLAEELFGKGGRLLAYCIAGHHAGLPDWSMAEGSGQSALEYQEKQLKDLNDIDKSMIEKIKTANPGSPPWRFNNGMDMSLWIRMLYSSLVDADFLDTEAYMKLNQAENRGDYCSMTELLGRYKQHISQMDDTSENTSVNVIRRNIRTKCIKMADRPQGIFSLSVPTGGGKTLSSLGFGLVHAIKHKLDRIIYVIPYTSIIEQNADVFRRALGEDQIVEHHSSIDEDDSTSKSRLAAENWDAPVIVTTSVQFFESLFAAKPSRCRKLHNIAKSVIILDEAQLVPIEFLRPILEVMQLLVDHYGVSFVISTATQPAFGDRLVDGKKFEGLKEITEIIGDSDEVKELYKSLKRTIVELPKDLHAVSDWQEVAEELKKHAQVLCIVSDRKSCRELFNLMPEGTLHLSALMCGQHRSEIINKIKQKLNRNEPIRVVSTQLVEAGVDLDFPIVFRALAGLDSIAQAAGRCNREGKLSAPGRVIMFNPPKKAPIGILRKATETTKNIFLTVKEDPLEYSLFERYFSELYWKANSLDEKRIVPLLTADHQECGIFFRTAAHNFQIIDDTRQKTIIVRYGESEDLIDLLKAKGPERWVMRRIQRYTVNIYNEDFYNMLTLGSIEEVHPQIYALSSKLFYSDQVGLLTDEAYNPEDFII